MELFSNTIPHSFIEDLSEIETHEDSLYEKVNHHIFGEILLHDCQELETKAFYTLEGRFLSMETKKYASKAGHTSLGLPKLRFIIHTEYLRDGSQLLIARGYLSDGIKLVEKHIMLLVNKKRYFLKCTKKNDSWSKKGNIPPKVIKKWRHNYLALNNQNALLNI